MSNKFKVGDKIIAKETIGGLDAGTTYTVTSYGKEGSGEPLVKLKEVGGGWYERRFDPVPAEVVAAPAAKPVKGFGTGKGTSQRIRDVFADAPYLSWNVAAVAGKLGLPSRQLHKRFAEQVKGGYLVKIDGFKPAMYKRA